MTDRLMRFLTVVLAFTNGFMFGELHAWPMFVVAISGYTLIFLRFSRPEKKLE